MKLQTLILVLVLPFLFNSSEDFGGKLVRTKNPVNVHIISIGLNDFFIGDDIHIGLGMSIENCVNDAKAIVEKIKADTPYLKEKNKSTTGSRGKGNIIRDTVKTDEKKSKVFTHLILEERATRENIRNAFKEVIKSSSSNDYFIFYYGGHTFETNNENTTYLTPYQNNPNLKGRSLYKNRDEFDLISIKELANFMNQIPANNQLVISESGLGQAFAQNLQAELFELDPDIALNTERNRIILTTVGLGYDFSKCNRYSGPLMHMILSAGDIFTVFNNYYHYEYLLNKKEIKCTINDTKYFYISQEKDYKKLLEKRFAKSFSRGAVGEDVSDEKDKEEKDKVGKTHALIIATNDYNDEQDSWANLKNPLNDANAISDLLETRFGVEVTKLYNEPRSAIQKGIIGLKNKVGENDKVLVFIAGHGYYSKNLSQGFIVTIDSKSLSEDEFLNSYLPWATLRGLLDGFDCKPMLTILDVCYGGSFELNEADLAPENYANTKFDNGFANFITDTDESFARVILASGADEVPDFWNDSMDHSPFADKLIEALEKEKEFISPGRIFSFVRGNITLPKLKKFGKHEVTGDFLLPVVN